MEQQVDALSHTHLPLVAMRALRCCAAFQLSEEANSCCAKPPPAPAAAAPSGAQAASSHSAACAAGDRVGSHKGDTQLAFGSCMPRERRPHVHLPQAGVRACGRQA